LALGFCRGGGGFDAFFAVSLPKNDSDEILILENGDYFGEYIFLTCIQNE
jgi:hypothetical protein